MTDNRPSCVVTYSICETLALLNLNNFNSSNVSTAIPIMIAEWMTVADRGYPTTKSNFRRAVKSVTQWTVFTSASFAFILINY